MPRITVNPQAGLSIANNRNGHSPVFSTRTSTGIKTLLKSIKVYVYLATTSVEFKYWNSRCAIALRHVSIFL